MVHDGSFLAPSSTVQDDTDLPCIVLYNYCCTPAVTFCEDSPIHFKAHPHEGHVCGFKAHEMNDLSIQHLKQEDDVTCLDCSSFAANARMLSYDRHVTCTSACAC